MIGTKGAADCNYSFEETEQLKLQITKQISDVFPDIQGQLCSRHSNLLVKLKAQFKTLYGLEPSCFIIAKGTCVISQKHTQRADYKLQMALENGVIFLVRPFDPLINQNTVSQVFINENNLQQQIILNASNSAFSQQSSNNFQSKTAAKIQKYQSLFSLATQDLSLNKICGGLIYAYANIPQGHFNYYLIFQIGLYLSFLSVNKIVENYTISQIITNLNRIDRNLFTIQFLHKYFYGFSNRNFIMSSGNQMAKVIPLEKAQKMIFCRIITQSQNVMLKKKELTVQANQLTQNIEIQRLYDNKTTFSQFIQAHQSTLCQQKISKIAQSIINFIQENNINAWKIINNNYLMIVANKHNYTEVLRKIKTFHKNEERYFIQKKWGNDPRIGQKIFTSVPSKAISILNPQQAIWFE